MKDKNTKNNKGYTLLFSIIVASVVLSIAAFILSVGRKQFILSSVSRDSTMAIYAADSAMQCLVRAFYKGQLATSSVAADNTVTLLKASVFCNGNTTLSDYETLPGGADADYGLFVGTENNITYKIEQTSNVLGFDFFNNSCAIAKITQGYDSTTRGHKIIIEARGYNDMFSAPCSPGKNNPRTVERAIRLIYLD